MLPPFVVVLGPTGAGKSDLGFFLARTFAGEIVGCDSIQVYRGLDIGSAKAAPDRRHGIPHHLIDILDANQYLTAGAYSRLARQALAAVQKKGSLPIVVGGTGLYLRALLDGLSPAPLRDDEIRARLAGIFARRPAALHRFLRRCDPPAAQRIHPNDRQKLVRAVELILLARQPVTSTLALPRDSLRGVRVLKLGLTPPRNLLYQHLDRRSAWMFANGLLAETRDLLDSGISPRAKPLQSLGYKQALKVLTQQLPLAAAILECQIKTRQYAKRQLTWFRREPDVHWLENFGENKSAQAEALLLVEKFLAV